MHLFEDTLRVVKRPDDGTEPVTSKEEDVEDRHHGEEIGRTPEEAT